MKQQWKFFVFLLILTGISISPLKSQTEEVFFSVTEKSGVKSEVRINDIRKLFFSDGDFKLQKKDGNTQTFSISDVKVMMFEYSSLVGIHQPEKKEIRSFPNPVVDLVTIESGSPIGDIGIFNISGQLIKQFQTSETSFTLDISEFNKGIYFIKTETNIQKIIKN